MCKFNLNEFYDRYYFFLKRTIFCKNIFKNEITTEEVFSYSRSNFLQLLLLQLKILLPINLVRILTVLQLYEFGIENVGFVKQIKKSTYIIIMLYCNWAGICWNKFINKAKKKLLNLLRTHGALKKICRENVILGLTFIVAKLKWFSLKNHIFYPRKSILILKTEQA